MGTWTICRSAEALTGTTCPPDPEGKQKGRSPSPGQRPHSDGCWCNYTREGKARLANTVHLKASGKTPVGCPRLTRVNGQTVKKGTTQRIWWRIAMVPVAKPSCHRRRRYLSTSVRKQLNFNA